MTKHYASFPTKWFSFFDSIIVNDVASSCQPMGKSTRVSLLLILVFIGALTPSQQIFAQRASSTFLKAKADSNTFYLTYASSKGIGGGGGGGHGNSDWVKLDYSNLTANGLLSKKSILKYII